MIDKARKNRAFFVQKFYISANRTYFLNHTIGVENSGGIIYMEVQLVTETVAKKVNAFANAAEKLGFVVSPLIGARIEDSATVVFAYKSGCDIAMTWHETLEGACSQLCDYLGKNYDKCEQIGNGVSLFNGKNLCLTHSLLRHSYDGGVFVLAKTRVRAKLPGELDDFACINEITNAIICA